MDHAKGETIMNGIGYARAFKWGKLTGVLLSAANGALTFSGRLAGMVGDKIMDTRRYKVEVIVEGATIKEHYNCSTKQVQQLMNATSQLGLTQLIVTEM